MPSEALTISSKFSTASPFSIFGIICGTCPFFLQYSLKSSISFAVLVNERAIKSTFFLIPKLISTKSFSVIVGNDTCSPIKLTCLFVVIFPEPLTTRQIIS